MNDDFFTRERNFNLGMNWRAICVGVVLVFLAFFAAFFFPVSARYKAKECNRNGDVSELVRCILKPQEAEAADWLDVRLDQLAWCESRNNPQAVNWNDGGSPSYGLFQFKEGTWKGYIRGYKLFRHAEDHELMNLIMDGPTQRIVARRMLQDGLYYHWKVCSTRYGWM